MQPGTAADGENRTFIETARRAQIVAAAIDTIADVGYAQASFARIAERLGISRGLISYHFAGKDDLIKQVVHEVVQQGIAYMRPRIVARSTGPTMLRAYIESNLALHERAPQRPDRDRGNRAQPRMGDASFTATAMWTTQSAPSSTCSLAARKSASFAPTSIPASWQ